MTNNLAVSTRVVVTVGVVVSALLVAVLIVVLVLVNTIATEADNQRYVECMAGQGFERGAVLPDMTEAEGDTYIDAAVEAAEFCSR